MRRAIILLALIACAGQPSVAPTSSSAPSAPPTPSAPPAGVVDLHVDLPYALHVQHRALDEAQASPRRLEAGGVRTILAPLFVLDAWRMSPAAARTAYEATYRDLQTVLPRLPATVALSLEGADGFADAPEALDAWMARGVCLVGLVHDHANALGGASQDPDSRARQRGLSEAGKSLARRVVAHGGLLDVAHASDATFDDLLAIARDANAPAPIVDSHTGMRALRDTMRNIDDARVRQLAATGGVVGISMHGGHIGSAPGQSPTLADVTAHVMHAIRVAGAAHVALGSDFDGGIDPPKDADGEAVWPRLRADLLARGVSGADVDAIFGGNATRVLAWSRAHGCTPGAR